MRAKESRQEACRLRRLGNDLPVGQRYRSAHIASYLCHEGGTAERAKASLLDESAKRGKVICGGATDDAVGGGVRRASFALGRHAS